VVSTRIRLPGGRSFLFFSAFFLAGVAIGTPFAARVLPMGRLYFWNMLGSGLAALPLLLAMNFAHPMHLLIAVTLLRRRSLRLHTQSLAAARAGSSLDLASLPQSS
jgi:hypothetical protein